MTGRALNHQRGAEPPRLVLEIPLEGKPTCYLRAESREDEQRLLLWFQGSGVAVSLIEMLQRVAP